MNKKTSIQILSLLTGGAILLMVAAACQKKGMDNPDILGGITNQICFNAEGEGLIEASVDTKASSGTTEVTSLSSFNVLCTKGSEGSETMKWDNYTFTNSSGTYYGASPGKWWPDTDENYHFYASNRTLTFAAAGTTISAVNTTDCLVAYIRKGTTDGTARYKTKNTLTFSHIFARLRRVTLAPASGYTISNVTIEVKPIVSGTYRIRDNSWSSTSEGSWTTVYRLEGSISSGTNYNDNDIYLKPGTYNLRATWTATRGDYTHTYTQVSSADLTMTQGANNNISTTLSGNATEITFGVSITPWGTTSPTATFSNAD